MAKESSQNIRKMERIDKPMIDARSANIQFGFERNTGNDVMHIKNLKIGYDAPITEPINIEVSKGDHIAVIGPNGVGKTTLIKTIAQNKTILAVASPLVQIFKLVIMIRNKQNLNRIKQF